MPSCQSCKATFSVAPEDVSFYTRVQVPPPTFCPECRMIRRFVFRNERAMYQDTCDLCKKSIISIYAPEKNFTVYCLPCWNGDNWDPMTYGREYDFSRPFLVQFGNLLRTVPRPQFFQRATESSPYANIVGESRNIHLSYSIVKCENVYYSKAVDTSRDCIDCLQVTNSEFCYEDVFGDKNYACAHTIFSRGCNESWFLYDCVNCQNCLLSTNLRNKQYYIRNKQYTKEEYQAEIGRMLLGSFDAWAKLRDEFTIMVKERAVHRFAQMRNTNESSGDNLVDTQNAKQCFEAYNLENVKYAVRAFYIKDSMDCSYIPSSELVYEVAHGALNNYNVRFATYAFNQVSHADYVDYCQNVSNLFGCVGLKQKQYCVLNRQYAKEDYEAIVLKIKKHMYDMPYLDTKGRVYQYGEFFPSEISLFAYNETIAQDYFPLTKEDARERGYAWREDSERRHEITVQAGDLPDHIQDAPENITSATIGCPHEGKCNELCTVAFKIVRPEFEYYKKARLPLPRLCPNCRHADRMRRRNPLRLWHRQCTCELAPHPAHAQGRCPNEFETTYAPERPEKVYCEPCYQAEVL